MQNEILLRKLIREMLLNEDEGLGDPGVSDAPQIDNHGNPKYGSTSFTSYSSGASGGTSDWLYGNLKTVTDPIKKGGADIAKSVGKAAAQAISISWLLSNPWTAAMFGDNWINKYLDTTEKGKTGEILTSTLKSALMKELNVSGITLPQVAAFSRIVSIPAAIHGIQYYMQRVKNNPEEYKIASSLFQSLSSINKSLPTIPQEIKSIFLLGDNHQNEKNAAEKIVFTLMKSKGKSPISQQLNMLESTSQQFVRKYPTPEDFIKRLTINGTNEAEARSLATLIFTSVGREDLLNSQQTQAIQQNTQNPTQPPQNTQRR